jgi:hypothetical protein
MERRYESDGTRRRAEDALLACGLASSLLYVFTDVIASLRYRGYSYRDQTVSELAAIGAPTRPLVVALFTVYGVLLTAFSAGAWLATREPASRRSAALLGVSALAATPVQPFFPMHRRGEVPGFTDAMHVAGTGLLSVLVEVSMGFAAAAQRGAWRAYTAATMAALLFFGAWTGLDSGRLAVNAPTPGMGLKERGNIYAYLAWVAAVSVSLMKRPAASL